MSTPCTAPACTAATHDALRADRERFRAETDYVGLHGLLGDGEDVLEFRNCRVCHSTLAILLATHEADGTWKVAA